LSPADTAHVSGRDNSIACHAADHRDRIQVNTPTHVASGIWLVQEIIARCPPRSARQTLLVIVAIIVLGPVVHLCLDELPHYNSILFVNVFTGYEHSWLIREVVSAIPVIAAGLYFARRNPGVALLGMFSAMYPDIEKLAALEWGLPESLAIFREHSLALSHNDYGMAHAPLIAGELILLAMFLSQSWLISRGDDAYLLLSEGQGHSSVRNGTAGSPAPL
jgi:hypothetical protein